ncbi:MAG: hypothetical protein A2Z59_00820 [Nitrospinae bacterium RIFCSPLOWO2_02_39_17]|nr:MAG: hypothetical protein A2W53_09225 [Nitrospinae bacterium RIFCSPHIGHO2_02_39_11]OGW01950.1 MAG: hypothetical protein A2Z59_00820 [Nitrospinae bacterium RIFCSPLOWO2_02_39_17]
MGKSQKIQENANLTLVIFPYLFLSKEYNTDGITLKPSFQNIIDQEEPIVKKQLLRIAEFFRYAYNKQVNAWSYYIAYLSNKKDWFSLRDRLNNLITILRYSNLSEPRNNALFSHFDYFIFEVNHLHLDDSSEFHYYDGLLNGENTIGFHTHKDSVGNPFSFHYEMSPLVLEDIENDRYLQKFYSHRSFSNKEEKRLLRAMEWFNRSFATTKEVDQADAIIHLESAFEALFKTDREGIKAQVQSGLIQFLGETNELIDWINQFWKLRCAIVHGDAELKPFFFQHTKGSKGHRDHVVMGRKIFTRCLDTFFQIRGSTYSCDIHEELVSNEVRIKETKKCLQNRAANDLKEAFHLISGLRKDDTSFSKKDTVAFGKMFLPFVIEDLRQENKNDIATNIETILKWSGSKYSDLALIYNEASTKYREFYFSNSHSISNPIPIETSFLRSAGYTFLDFAIWRLLTFFD